MKSLKSWCHKQYGQYVIKCVIVTRGLTTAGRLSSALKKLDNETLCGYLPRVIARVLNIIRFWMFFRKIAFVKYSEIVRAQ